MFSRGSSKDVEIFYSLSQAISDTSQPPQLAELDYLSSEGKIVQIPLDCRKLKLALRFFQESLTNLVKLRINYTFTLKSDKDSKKAVVK